MRTDPFFLVAAAGENRGLAAGLGDGDGKQKAVRPEDLTASTMKLGSEPV